MSCLPSDLTGKLKLLVKIHEGPTRYVAPTLMYLPMDLRRQQLIPQSSV